MDSFIEEFKLESIHQLNLNIPRISKCLDQLSEEEVWKKPNASSNSIANLILHLCGNIRQYIISSLGNEQDERNRPEEFSIRSGYSKVELLDKISQTIKEAVEIIENVSTEELLRKRNIQAFNMSGIGIVIHVTEHFSYHTGQIAFWTKLLKDQDLGFYSGLNLESRNKE